MVSSEDPDVASRSGSPGSAGEMNEGQIVDQDVKVEGRQDGEGEVKKKDPKDPSRPRRKKARRACHACQRAHLTCGDERPCQRCVKRGLGEQCCDGVRKKAKYLHDTPNEAFMPGGMTSFGYMDTMRQARPQQEGAYNLSPSNEVFSPMQGQQPGFGLYRQDNSPPQVRETAFGPQPFMPQTPTAASAFSSPTTSQQNMQSLLDAAQRSMSMDQAAAVSEPFSAQFFDPNDPSKYNFDLSAFNFGNHYGALEFGMLGQMATGAAETPPSDAATQMGQNYASPAAVTGYSDGQPGDRSFSMTSDPSAQGWQQPSMTQELAQYAAVNNQQAQNSRQKPLPAAIPMNISHTVDLSGRPTGTLTPPASEIVPQSANTSGSNPASVSETYASDGANSSVLATAKLFAPQQPGRNTSAIYSSVTKEYSYVTSWHNLLAFMRKRFPPEKIVRVAKAISAFRPSFIGATKSLSKADLIFMEQAFQRSLCMYEDFQNDVCIPMIICRRTGEVAAVSDEFVQLTGWSRDILLGKIPNLNVNTGKSHQTLPADGSGSIPGSGVATANGSGRGFNTPRATEVLVETSRPQAVFHAELMDDDSVIEFYEDFARLAFGEPRGRVTNRVKLLKYKTNTDLLNANRSRPRDLPPGWADHGTGSDDAVIECQCVWTIKRDVFDLPMMIVLNFLPILDQQPQLSTNYTRAPH